MAGKEIQRLSFNLNRTMVPQSISNARPREDIINRKLYFKPTSCPRPPMNSKKIIDRLSFSNPNRLNSAFILGEIK